MSSFCDEPKESKTRYYRHEVNIGIGGIGVRSGWSDDYERNVMNRFGLVIYIKQNVNYFLRSYQKSRMKKLNLENSKHFHQNWENI